MWNGKTGFVDPSPCRSTVLTQIRKHSRIQCNGIRTNGEKPFLYAFQAVYIVVLRLMITWIQIRMGPRPVLKEFNAGLDPEQSFRNHIPDLNLKTK